MYYINFGNDVFIDENINLEPVRDIFRIFLNKCDSFQIKILKEDAKYKKLVEEYEIYSDDNSYEYIFQGMVDEDFKEMILKNLIGENAINFTDISLYDDGKLKIEIINYGSEVYIYDFDEKSVVSFAEELEKIYRIKNINVYTDEEDEHDNHSHECNCEHNHNDKSGGDCSCGHNHIIH